MAVSFHLFTTHKNDKTSSFGEYGPVTKVFERGTISQRKVYERDIFLSKWYKKGKGLDHAARHYHIEPWLGLRLFPYCHILCLLPLLPLELHCVPGPGNESFALSGY